MLRFEKIKNTSGIAAFIALVVMIMLTLVGLAAIRISDDEVNISGNELNEMAAFYAAEAGLERASAAIQAQYETTGAPPSVMPSGSETVNNCVVAYNTVDNGAAVQKTLSLGTLAGLHALSKIFTITAVGVSGVDRSHVQLTHEFECDLIPIFQFAVFYDNDLETAPGPDMTLLGRVHSNANIWLNAGSNLYMNSYLTCSGNLLHGRKGPGSVDAGSIFIKDTDGNYQNMKNADGTFLSSASSNWYDSATARWGGRVQDSIFGQEKLNLPLSATGDPHKIIERASGNPDSYENRADLKIIKGSVYALVGGVWTNVTTLLPAGAVTSNDFYDPREGKTVKSTDIDMSLLKLSPYYPVGGIIYASNDQGGFFHALRLKNGSDIGGAVSVFSENPIYVQGDFNSINKAPTALVADAVTFLSNSWVDSTSTMSLNDRVASETICNASIITGNTNTTSTYYNGGLESLPRFLEKWDGVTFHLAGSMVNLWNSQQAIGNWSYGTYYTDPVRDWKYDTDLDDPNNLPPGTPTARVFLRLGWQQQYVGYDPESTQ
jgi:hypothetical protein